MPRSARHIDQERLNVLKNLIRDDRYVSEAVRVLATDLAVHLIQRDDMTVSDGNDEPSSPDTPFHGA
ncbi:MAG: hypothetical protein ACOC4I_00305 [Spirochaetota bacterium]